MMQPQFYIPTPPSPQQRQMPRQGGGILDQILGLGAGGGVKSPQSAQGLMQLISLIGGVPL